MGKMFGIRHIRYFFWLWRFKKHLSRCRNYGFGYTAQQSDLDYLQGIWDGKL